MARNGRASGDRRAALKRMADADPELAVRLVAQALPAAAAELRPPLRFRLDVDGVDSWLVEATADGPARVSSDGAGAEVDFAVSADAASFARLAAGANPLPLLASRRVRVSGKRRRALALRRLSQDAGPRQLARVGLPVDPDLA
jgi:SCP-2 sterol transfer family